VTSLADLRIQVDQFEGPLSLLLQLIEREQLEVTRVSVVSVADSFLALVNEAHTTDLATVGEFIAMAARLLVMKSRALLRAQPGAVADLAEPDDAEALARQIAEYRRYQQPAAWIADRRDRQLLALPRPPRRATELERRPPPVNVHALRRAAMRLLAPPTIGLREEEWPDVEYQSLRRDLLATLSMHRYRTFEQLCGGAWHPLVVITLFLALMDTVRVQLVRAEQLHPFATIIVALAPEPAGDAG
jgi:segregation and condensation protein A